MVAIRADMDALKMAEENHDITYKTTNEYAHMCGHDGHMTMVLGAAQVLIANRAKIPSDCTVRILY